MKTFVLYEKDIYHGNLVLINKNYLLKISEKRTLKHLVGFGEDSHQHLIHKHTAKALKDTLKFLNVKKEITPVSAFRSKEEQSLLYDNSIKNHGIDFTQKYVAIPDASEHQSGLAIDLGENKKNIHDICPDFPNHGIFRKFRKEAVRRGFIERYKKGKESITGISEEPWHFRYVGFPHSVIIEGNNFTLEEYHSFIKNYTSVENSYRYNHTDTEFRIYYKKFRNKSQSILIEDEVQYEVSGNNFDGFIVTVWKANA